MQVKLGKEVFSMKKFSLNGKWNMTGGGYNCDGNIPGSVYSFLLDNKLMDDPYYRTNELQATPILENDFLFSKKFKFFEKSRNINKILTFA